MISRKVFLSASQNHLDSHRNPWRCPHQSSSPCWGWDGEGLCCCWSWPGWSTFCWPWTSWFLSGTWWCPALTVSSRRWRIHPPCCRHWSPAPWLVLKIFILNSDQIIWYWSNDQFSEASLIENVGRKNVKYIHHHISICLIHLLIFAKDIRVEIILAVLIRLRESKWINFNKLQLYQHNADFKTHFLFTAKFHSIWFLEMDRKWMDYYYQFEECKRFP